MDKIQVTTEQWLAVFDSIHETLAENDTLCMDSDADRGVLRRELLDSIAEHVSFVTDEEVGRG